MKDNRTFQIYGQDLGIDEQYKSQNTDNELKKTILVSNNRSDYNKIKFDTKEDDIINLVFEDGSEWIGPAQNIQEIFAESQFETQRNSSEPILLPNYVQGTDSDRGINKVVVKLINIFSKKKKSPKLPVDKLVENFALKFDKKVVNEVGLHVLDRNLRFTSKKIRSKSKQHFLVLVHGTYSSIERSYGKIIDKDDPELIETLFDTYGENNILGFEHYTLSESPVKNAIDLMDQLPANCKIDIVSTSRGGLVADLITRCSADNENDVIGFKDEDIKFLEGEKIHAELKKLIDLANDKQIEVHKLIRVACPADGTDLVSKRLDHFFNFLLRVVGLAFGSIANPLYHLVKSLIMEVLNTRTDPDILPGIYAMVPNSPFQRLINNKKNLVSSNVVFIAGNTEVKGVNKGSIITILSNLYFHGANDYIVNTASMFSGLRSKKEIYYVLTEDENTNHFNYFKNRKSRDAFSKVIKWNVNESLTGFEKLDQAHLDEERGVISNLLLTGRDCDYQKISGDNPIVLFLPGVMGSNLEVNDEKIWLDLSQIFNGKLCTLLDGDKEVDAKSITGKYYTDFLDYLIKKNYDVAVFPYDWRNSVKESAKLLNKKIKEIQSVSNKPLKIVAHSMGGLVVRQFMIEFQEEWKGFINRKGAQFLMFGTPWNGSYEMFNVLLGNSSKINMLALLDMQNSRKAIVETIRRYPGLYELLPIEDDNDQYDFENVGFWRDLCKEIKGNKYELPDNEILKNYKKFKENVKEHTFKTYDNVYYIAGVSDSTIDGYRLKQELNNKSINFLSTRFGDGTVSWRLGLPDHILPENKYLMNAAHGNLLNYQRGFQGILEILEKGESIKLDTFNIEDLISDRQGVPIVNRQGVPIVNKHDTPESFRQGVPIVNRENFEYQELNSVDMIFGAVESKTSKKIYSDTIAVTVSNGDLQFSDYPVIVGHFKQDGIMLAEKSLDGALGGDLSLKHSLGIYPSEIGESCIVTKKDGNAKGAIIVGLGENSDLTPFLLSKTIEKGVLNYIFHVTENVKPYNKNIKADGISSLCIATEFSGLTLETGLNAIITGINNANLRLKNIGRDDQRIKKIEIIELFENKSREAFYILKKIEDLDNNLNIKVKNKIIPKKRALKKLKNNYNQGYWHSIMTEYTPSHNGTHSSFNWQSSDSSAKVDEEQLFASEVLVNEFLSQVEDSAQWDSTSSKVLFEMLVPNRLKQILRNQTNIVWKMDLKSASYPWEMLHDNDIDKTPTFTNAGLIRQILTPINSYETQVIKTKSALVIGDPIYENLSQLNGAKAEAEKVARLLKEYNWDINGKTLIRAQSKDIITKLITEKYQILHIAGHGDYDPVNNKTGIKIGNTEISPQTLSNFSVVPEFAFINCCFSGKLHNDDERFYRDRYKFAANIGTQLIEMGVKAVVVTGWAVNDTLAQTFAQTFYKAMLTGSYFGEAVKMARKATYFQNKDSNTWSAYQCYGNPWYTFVNQPAKSLNGVSYIIKDELFVDLHNLIEEIKTKQFREAEIVDKLESIINAAKDIDLYDATIIEKEAEIYFILGNTELALDRYYNLLKLNQANFSVKSFEQYCNLLSKRLFIINEKDIDENIEDLDLDDKIKEVKEQFDSLLLISNTPERLSLFGSAYKRFAYLKEVLKEKDKSYLLNVTDEQKRLYPWKDTDHPNYFIEFMCDKYKNAYENMVDDPRKYSYPLCNWLTGQYFLDPEIKISFDNKDYKILTVLNKVEKLLRLTKKQYIDFWEDIALVNVLMCQILYTIDNKEKANLAKEVIKIYQKAWLESGTNKNLFSELEHCDFVLKILDRDKEKNRTSIRYFNQIREKLEDLKL